MKTCFFGIIGPKLPWRWIKESKKEIRTTKPNVLTSTSFWDLFQNYSWIVFNYSSIYMFFVFIFFDEILMGLKNHSSKISIKTSIHNYKKISSLRPDSFGCPQLVGFFHSILNLSIYYCADAMKYIFLAFDTYIQVHQMVNVFESLLRPRIWGPVLRKIPELWRGETIKL